MTVVAVVVAAEPLPRRPRAAVEAVTEAVKEEALPPLREAAEAEVGVEPQLPLAATVAAVTVEAAVSWVAAAVTLLPLPLVAAVAVTVVAVIKREAPSSVEEAAPQLLRLRADPAAAVTVVAKGEAASVALLPLLRSLRVAAMVVEAVTVAAAMAVAL